ncbi:hypothetical protein K437DRAFT_253912 [Tilletiaria anomala UBC 951]|uniref:Uncharacterized protein n=1 Tax=Tilletiaria anomala (strain ATCC 24038 / CBS 436.72 / UBC 951) TaxID=1037660 RepID=A0A066WQ19_TILAU|nr:uncharacterized protein K437DRAFT_253912 [Tilletiaria anomala UBC 951]KDN52720.1 hypothetical protein K437DRAFT_253912 [Tilletiaria anomala UBC 951]
MALRTSVVRMAAFRSSPRVGAPHIKPAFQPHVGRFAPENVFKASGALAFWGVAGAGGVALFLSGVPKFKHDVLLKIPFVNQYFQDNTPDSDKPF